MYETIKQLYADIQTLTAAMPSYNATKNTAALFNANLDAVLKEYPSDPILTAIGHATEDTTYYDLLIMAGQLMSGMKSAIDDRAAGSMAASSRPARKMI